MCVGSGRAAYVDHSRENLEFIIQMKDVNGVEDMNMIITGWWDWDWATKTKGNLSTFLSLSSAPAAKYTLKKLSHSVRSADIEIPLVERAHTCVMESSMALTATIIICAGLLWAVCTIWRPMMMVWKRSSDLLALNLLISRITRRKVSPMTLEIIVDVDLYHKPSALSRVIEMHHVSFSQQLVHVIRYSSALPVHSTYCATLFFAHSSSLTSYGEKQAEMTVRKWYFSQSHRCTKNNNSISANFGQRLARCRSRQIAQWRRCALEWSKISLDMTKEISTQTNGKDEKKIAVFFN